MQIFDDEVSLSAHLDTLALTNPTVASASGGEVEIIGGYPAAPGVLPSVVGIRSTLTVSATAPYYPAELSFASAGEEDFANWGAVPAFTPPTRPRR